MLMDDVCRCHDASCHERQACKRWVHREQGGPRTPHSWSLYPLPDGETQWSECMVLEHLAPCPNKIDA